MILRDFHLHTTYCDGKSTPLEVVLSAIEKGVKTLGITTHCYTPFHIYGNLSPSSVYEFANEINALKARFKDKIDIYCGIEEDYFGQTDLSKFDYVIGDVHYLSNGVDYYSVDHGQIDIRECVEKVFGGDAYKALEKYFEQMVAVVKRTNADIVGHFDVITKNNNGGAIFNEGDPRYVSAWKNAVDEILKFKPNIYFEVNTGGISRGYKNIPYPSKEIADYIKSKGGKLLLTSDSHHKDTLCYEFEKWAKEYEI
ncbi:MAG: histidinol-phosphatase HisJ family protein [Clostridia bacterium]|nr:histidinol-phosphatase HisJ family protein [Clostridia bacterium]